MTPWLGPAWLGRLQKHLQHYPGASRDWTWRMRLGNGIAELRYWIWIATGGTHDDPA